MFECDEVCLNVMRFDSVSLTHVDSEGDDDDDGCAHVWVSVVWG